MRFPADIFTMMPASNDLYACVIKSTEILKLHKIIDVPGIYSPFSVLVFNIFTNFPFEYVRIGSFILTGICLVILVVYGVGFYQKRIWHSSASVFVLALFFMSYGCRFELERGQINLLVMAISIFGMFLSRSMNKFKIILGFVFLSFAVQMKVWPLFFLPLFTNAYIGIIRNVKRFIIFGLSNFFLLFVLGYDFLKEYLLSLSNLAKSPLNIWVANMSLYSFKIQVCKYYGLNEKLMTGLVLTFSFAILAVITCAVCNAQYYKNISLVYLSAMCGMLFPNISYDYKLVVLYVVSILFYSCYEEKSFQHNILSKSVVDSKLTFSFSISLALRRVAYLVPLAVLPLTMFSYVYKADMGLLICSNTLVLVISAISVCYLVINDLFQTI